MKTLLILIVLFLLLGQGRFADSDEPDLGRARTAADKNDFEKAYHIALDAIQVRDQKIQNLTGLVEFYREKLKTLETAPQTSSISIETIENAERLWREAWNLQRTAIFKKVGREKTEMLMEAIEKFRNIVTSYPSAKRAQEAQYRIGRIYSKFLKDHQKAKEEFDNYLQNYPNGNYTKEIQEEIRN